MTDVSLPSDLVEAGFHAKQDEKGAMHLWRYDTRYGYFENSSLAIAFARALLYLARQEQKRTL